MTAGHEQDDAPSPWWYTVISVLIPVVVTFVAVMWVSLSAIGTYTGFSPLDEFQHLDSTAKAADGDLWLPLNDRVGNTAMALEACRGINFAQQELPSCDSLTFSPEDFQELGVNTAAGRPSLYYIATAIPANLIAKWQPQWDFLDAARISSALALATGAALLAAAASRLSRSLITGSAIGVIVGLFPAVVAQGATVNPDSWSLLAGTVIVSFTLLRRRLPVWVYAAGLSVLLAIFCLTKANFVVLAAVPVTMSFILAQGKFLARVRHVWPEWLAAGISLLVFGAVTVAPLLAGEPSDAPMSTVLAISPDNPWSTTSVINQSLAAVLPQVFDPSYAYSILARPPLSGMALVTAIFLISASFVGILHARVNSRYFALSVAAIITIFAAPLFTFAGQFAVNTYFSYPLRYGFVAVPVVALAMAALRPRRAPVACVALGVLCCYAVALSGVDLRFS